MNLFERTKQFAEIQFLKGLVKVLPRLSEEKLLGLARPYMEKTPFEGGKDAMRKSRRNGVCAKNKLLDRLGVTVGDSYRKVISED